MQMTSTWYEEGIVLCARINKTHKRYLQYIGYDRNKEQDIIQIFETVYTTEESPSIDSIIRDKVLFFTKTYLYNWIREGYWEITGKGKVKVSLHAFNLKVNYPTGWFVWNAGSSEREHKHDEITDGPLANYSELKEENYAEIMERLSEGYEADFIKPKKERMTKGSIFCLTVRNDFKVYMQLIGKKGTFMGAHVTCVFKRHYPIHYEPTIEEILDDEVDFYSLHYLFIPQELGAIIKVGTSKDLHHADNLWLVDKNSWDDDYFMIKYGDPFENRQPFSHKNASKNPVFCNNEAVPSFNELYYRISEGEWPEYYYGVRDFDLLELPPKTILKQLCDIGNKIWGKKWV